MAPHTPTGKTRSKVYQFVRRRLLAGEAPSVREVQEAFGFRAVQSAHQHLQALVEEGLLAKTPGRRSRGYRLPRGRRGAGSPAAPPGGAPGASLTTAWIPLVGRVQAGRPAEAVENLEGYLAVPSRERDEEAELFALRVKGPSMKDDGILDGDIVVVRRQSAADSGDIVVAMVGDEATVKRLEIRKNRVRLLPANEAFEPIVVESGELVILGRVVEIRRYLKGSTPPVDQPPRS